MNSIEDLLEVIATEAAEASLEDEARRAKTSNKPEETIRYSFQVVVGKDGKPVMLED